MALSQNPIVPDRCCPRHSYVKMVALWSSYVCPECDPRPGEQPKKKRSLDEIDWSWLAVPLEKHTLIERVNPPFPFNGWINLIAESDLVMTLRDDMVMKFVKHRWCVPTPSHEFWLDQRQYEILRTESVIFDNIRYVFLRKVTRIGIEST